MHRALMGVVLASIVPVASGWGPLPAAAQTPPAPPSAAQLDKLVAPIALYPDPLVAQILPASTYPVQVVEAARDLADGGRPNDQAASQWDPSVQALLSYPTVLKMMSDKINWTTQLGQAVAANQGDVMQAVQRVRRQAQAAGNLKSNDKQVVNTQGSGDTSTIIIEPASPEYIYVPQYDPVAVLAPAPVYAYGAVPPAYGLMTFGVGFAAGAATAYACHWGSGSYGSVTVNNSYHYSSTNNYSAYHPSSGTYTGYNAKTGTYGAYNPETGKYGTYNPSTGAYNKDGQTGTVDKSSGNYSSWHPPSSSEVGRSADNYNADQYRAGGTGQSGYHSDPAGGGQYHGPDTAGGNEYRGADSTRGTGGEGDTGRLGSEPGAAARNSGGGGFNDRASGGDAFHGADGGGWGAREASDRGASSAGDRSFGGGSFHGGGGGGFRGCRGGGFRGGRR